MKFLGWLFAGNKNENKIVNNNLYDYLIKLYNGLELQDKGLNENPIDYINNKKHFFEIVLNILNKLESETKGTLEESTVKQLIENWKQLIKYYEALTNMYFHKNFDNDHSNKSKKLIYDLIADIKVNTEELKTLFQTVKVH